MTYETFQGNRQHPENLNANDKADTANQSTLMVSNLNPCGSGDRDQDSNQGFFLKFQNSANGIASQMPNDVLAALRKRVLLDSL